MLCRRHVLGPGRRVQVLVHDKFPEVEEVEADLGKDFPASFFGNGFKDFFQISVNACILFRHLELREFDPELFHLSLEGEGGKDIVPGPLQAELAPFPYPFQLYRDQDKGSFRVFHGRPAVSPLQETEGQVEHGVTLFFEN